MPIDAGLMQALNFTEEDLMENVAGRLSKRQRALLSRRFLIMRAVALVILLVGLAAIALIFGSQAVRGGVIWLAVGAPFLVAWLFLARLILHELEHALQDIQRHRVHAEIGVVHRITTKTPENQTVRFVHVNERQFKVSTAVYEAFQEDVLYRVFYLPMSMMIVSAEPGQKPVE